MARRYSDEEKAQALAALDANGGNVKRTAGQLGIPVSTLREWARGRGVVNGVTKIRHQKKGELADELETIAWRVLDALPEKLAEADARALATLLGIVIDKVQLLRGQPTDRTAITGVQIYLPDNGRQ